MSKIQGAVGQIEELNSLSDRDNWVNLIHPFVKVALAITYICFVVSFNSEKLFSLVAMGVYLIFVFIVGEISFVQCMYRLRIILPLVFFVGILNPFFDRQPALQIGGVVITTGMLSMCCLMIKGLYTVLAGYILIATTSIDEICYSLRLVHVPTNIVVVILLIYRYIFMLIKETHRVMSAYKLRASSQNGIHYRVWGPLVGQLLLRSLDKAQMIYDAMELRGFNGQFFYLGRKNNKLTSFIYYFIWLVIFVVIRNTVFLIKIGQLLGF